MWNARMSDGGECMYVARMTNSQLNCYLFICMQSKTEPIELRIVLNEMKYLYRLGE